MLAEPNVGGWGGSALGDGASALIATTDGDTYNFPVEVVEARFPVLVERYELNVGRGRRCRAGTAAASASCASTAMHGGGDAYGYGSIGGSERRPWALGGGREGPTNYLEYVRDGVAGSAGAGCARVSLERRGTSSAPSPAPAAASAIRASESRSGSARTSCDGYVTLECAREVYGVALDPETLEIDAAVTAALRAG